MNQHNHAISEFQVSVYDSGPWSPIPAPQLSPIDSSPAMLRCSFSCVLLFSSPLQEGRLRGALQDCLATCPMMAGR